ncbi:hypothetical protein [Paenibacillus apii]|uniref:hypothetical protein n=1 Tax=Paenibacillus apii TaxID=1850370 RepID=UPI00143B6B1F|nr:hypothetical protein [Paenibacillus apii]NJJ37833.1 hypothetical protein [Paenibacillus apii]
MGDYAEESAKRLLEDIRRASGPYAAFAEAARRKYERVRIDQEKGVRAIFRRVGDDVAREIRALYRRGYGSTMSDRYAEQIKKTLRSADIAGQLTAKMTGYIHEAADAGTSYAFELTREQFDKARLPAKKMDSLIFRTNKQAVEAIWARSEKGLLLSDRIWLKGIGARNAITEIIQNAVAGGEDPADTARVLERYIRRGKKTVAADYPNMMERMGSRVPGDLSYEALRLVRTETAAAFGEGTILAARATPSYIGMRWVLSGVHPKPDICDEYAGAENGLGRGVWSPGQEPHMPAHPNCLCVLISVHEEPDAFQRRMKRWLDDPSTEPDIERWYNEKYNPPEEPDIPPKLHFNADAGPPEKPTFAQQVKRQIETGVGSEQEVRGIGRSIRDEVERQQKPLTDQIRVKEEELRGYREQILRNPTVGTYNREYDRAFGELQQLRNTFRAQRPEVIHRLLSEIRPMGNPGRQRWMPYSNEQVVDAIEAVGAAFPSDWWTISNESAMTGLLVERGYYRPGKFAVMALSGTSLERVAIHELGHRFESIIPQLLELEHEFYARRTAGEELQWLGPGYDKAEMSRFDRFVNPYMGKDYGGEAFEFLSMGFEGLFALSFDLSKDTDFEEFILGVLASI